MHTMVHICIDSPKQHTPFDANINHTYANPNFFNMCEASYSKPGDVLGVVSMLFLNNFNNSLIKALDVPCVQQQFKN
jgi:hypothetical protein